jgi:hypothetical protein
MESSYCTRFDRAKYLIKADWYKLSNMRAQKALEAAIARGVKVSIRLSSDPKMFHVGQRRL